MQPRDVDEKQDAFAEPRIETNELPDCPLRSQPPIDVGALPRSLPRVQPLNDHRDKHPSLIT
eukprot:11706193-Karenia_brevis.AAC.2